MKSHMADYQGALSQMVSPVGASGPARHRVLAATIALVLSLCAPALAGIEAHK